MREINWQRLRKASPFIVIASFAFFYLHTCQGPFLSSSDCQAVSPDGNVKAILISSGSGCARGQPPYDALEFESREWIQKPAGVIYDTTGEFVDLRWTSPKTLEVTGRRLEKKLLNDHHHSEFPKDVYQIVFREIGLK